MDFVQHSLNWCKGELFEAKLILAFGLAVAIIALLFYFLGNTPGAKAMLLPLLVVGILFSVIGGGMLYSNPKRMAEFPAAYEADPAAFIQAEKDRVATFISWYPKTRYIMAGLALIGLGCFLFWESPIGRAIGIALLLMALTTFVVDHFSEERAETYYEHILAALKNLQ